ncbi:MAG: hypothetical protein HZB29_08965 [Nitrospinae bacterium]|nr:hypothetical protein [Nitrospinota bacterium]
MSELSKINSTMRGAAIRTLLRNHPRILCEVLDESCDINQEMTPDNVDYDDTGEILLRVAWDIWNGSGEAEFHRVLNELPAEDFEAFVDAMKDFAALRAKIRFAYASGSQND